jgi:hypothetical protein
VYQFEKIPSKTLVYYFLPLTKPRRGHRNTVLGLFNLNSILKLIHYFHFKLPLAGGDTSANTKKPPPTAGANNQSMNNQ